MKTTIIALIVIVLIGLGLYFVSTKMADAPVDQATTTVSTTTTTTTTEVTEETSIGMSKEGREIPVYHYGEGDKEVVFVGGIHGGYEWNTTLLAYELMDYLDANGDKIPEDVKVTVIPVLNPDGLNKVVGTSGRFTKADVPTSESATVPGRFNANNVDLNRNFDCDWQASGTWQDKTVSGGTAAFSEVESQAMRDYVQENDPEAVVVYYSAAGGVYASNCHDGVLPETLKLTNTYASASGYPASEEFDFYEITGDMVNWLAKEKVPAISVLLTDHTNTEWDKNWKGIEAVLKSIAD
ncbi:MAG: Peptidase protein [Patescibacteria group bacterium]|nr:Peptidase protein [Patescibacteria group bacterium]